MGTDKNRIQGILLVLLASMCWGTTGRSRNWHPQHSPSRWARPNRYIRNFSCCLVCWRDGGLGFLRRTSIPALLVSVAGLVGFQFSFFTP